MRFEHKLAELCIAASFLFGALGAFAALSLLPKSQGDAAREFYSTEVAFSVSPSDYMYELRHGRQTGLVVDLRSAGQYAENHLITAVNVPAGQMDEKQVVAAFRNLPGDKPFITYCYSSYCMLSRKVGDILAKNGIYAKHMTAGWYEIERDFGGYLVNGTGPGVLAVPENETGEACDPQGDGEFGC